MDNISIDDLVNNLADLQVTGSVAVIGANASEVVEILSQKWGLSANNPSYYVENALGAIASSEVPQREYNLVILLPDVLAQVYAIEERYQKIAALAQTLRPEGRLVILVVDPGNLGVMARRWDDGSQTQEEIVQASEVDWVHGIRRYAQTEAKTAIISRSELLLSFAAAKLVTEEEPLTRANDYPSIGLQRFIARYGLRSVYSSGELYNALLALPEAYKKFVLDYISPGMEALELGSGSGRLSLPLLEQGAKVTGIEIDRGMLQEAEIKLRPWIEQKQLELIHGNIACFELQRQFDLAILSGEVLSYLAESEERYQFFQCAAAHLKPSAHLLIILDNPAVYLQGGYRRTRTRQRQLSDGSILRMTEERSYDPVGMYQLGVEQYCTLASETFFQWSQTLKHGVILPDEIRLQAHLTGLKLVEIYGNYQREMLQSDSPRAIYVLEKI